MGLSRESISELIFGIGAKLTPDKSFAKVLADNSIGGVIPSTSPSILSKHGDVISIAVDMHAYKKWLKLFQFSLMARGVLS